ncbi:hypothetical protein [Sphingobium sp. CAP-1]|uniref:hypothetical protein n=1 Tax=Sphingobium sp. CAP-1 TaxID=2676077 RepID=UPI001E2D9ACC|nr:hypothetical protein [Sphingobium sp. CAP-1]
MTEPAPVLHAYVCTVCGSDHVTRDAWAAWDVAAQDWVLEAAFDYAHCHRCMGGARLERVVLTSPVTFALPEIAPSATALPETTTPLTRPPAPPGGGFP